MEDGFRILLYNIVVRPPSTGSCFLFLLAFSLMPASKPRPTFDSSSHLVSLLISLPCSDHSFLDLARSVHGPRSWVGVLLLVLFFFLFSGNFFIFFLHLTVPGMGGTDFKNYFPSFDPARPTTSFAYPTGPASLTRLYAQPPPIYLSFTGDSPPLGVELTAQSLCRTWTRSLLLLSFSRASCLKYLGLPWIIGLVGHAR